MMPEGKTMYTVADLIKHLRWADPKATVTTIDEHGNHLYLSMDGHDSETALLLFEPRHEFNDIKVYYKCDHCNHCYLDNPRESQCYFCGSKVTEVIKEDL